MGVKRRKKEKRAVSRNLVFIFLLILIFSIGFNSGTGGFGFSSYDGETGGEPEEKNNFQSEYTAGSGLEVYFLDVGQGDAIFISCDGHNMMIDGGESDQSQKIYAFLTSKSISKIDVMVASHPHSDHVGGLSAAFRSSQVGIVYSPVSEYDTKAFANLLKACETFESRFTVLEENISFPLGEAQVYIYVPPVYNSTNMNDNSLICRVIYKDTSFLFTGDMEKEEESLFLEGLENLNSDVIKIGHHGSNTSTTEAFLEEVDPAWAVISVGRENQYGHPSAEIIDRLSEHNTVVYRTDLNGTVQCISDGYNIYWKTEK